APSESPDIHDLLVAGQHFSDAGDYDLAIEKFNQVLQLEPKNKAAVEGKRVAESRRRFEEQHDSDQP
ncbi:MAG TPA: tetratricopeptide repeat protein, partial [Terriglobales bacterium]|nr:tetratricopeptide repeat protein [Terriglobales bacterium]